VAKTNAIVYSPGGGQLPEALRRWLAGLGVPIVTVESGDELMALSLRGRPRVVAFDARQEKAQSLDALRRVKGDSYTGVVPCVVATCEADGAFAEAFEAGADEVMQNGMAAAEATTRLDAMLRRSDRDLVVHPSTRLPGAVEIEAEITRRLNEGKLFATCYADLDHFKEFNDRYSYYDGDRVIYLLSRILHDVVKGLLGPRGFVGHIGGDDFIFVIPAEEINAVCSEILDVFDTLIPLQYNDQDRRAGYFFGKDRRGQLHRVPLMTLSIGIVTNRHRRFAHPAQVSELATEMKSYAKTLPGSVFVVDRRQGTNGEERSGAASREHP
jgi:GGDEF domain-containing protein